jgi:hypothetical protein
MYQVSLSQESSVQPSNNRINAKSVVIETLKGTMSWYVTVIVLECCAFMLIALGLGLLSNLSDLLRLGFAVSYFLLLITTCFLSMFVRDQARERRIRLGQQQQMNSQGTFVNLPLRVGVAATFFAIAIVIFILILAIPTEFDESFERVGLAAIGLFLVLCTFLSTKTMQDRKEAVYWQEHL